MAVGVLSGELDGSSIEVVFEAYASWSDIRVLTFDDFRRDAAGRWATHELIGTDQKPILEFLGPGLESIDFSVQMSASLGVTPLEELVKLRQLRDNGVVCNFIIGGSQVSINYWTVMRVSEAHGTYDGAGRLLSARADVSLTEYVKLPKEA